MEEIAHHPGRPRRCGARSRLPSRGVRIRDFLPPLPLHRAARRGLLRVLRHCGAHRQRSEEKHAGDALFIFTSGVLGLFIVKVPTLAGILLGLVKSSLAGTIGQILRLVGLGLGIASWHTASAPSWPMRAQRRRDGGIEAPPMARQAAISVAVLVLQSAPAGQGSFLPTLGTVLFTWAC